MSPIDRIKDLNYVYVDPVGSRVTCNSAPTDTDEDYLVFINANDSKAFYNAISQDNWVTTTHNYAFDKDNMEVGFTSYRNGNLNIIHAGTKDFHRRFLAATAVAKRLNLLSKPDRIALFQAVLYGNA